MENIDKMNAKKIAIANFIAVVIMALLAFGNELAIISFFIGILAAIINFVAMIYHITRKEPYSYITCIISMLLMPIIGFGCCSSSSIAI
jgi:K+-sensing histidine kinase KdpD